MLACIMACWPLLDHILDSSETSKGANDFVKLALANTDQRIQSGKSVVGRILICHLTLARSFTELESEYRQRDGQYSRTA